MLGSADEVREFLGIESDAVSYFATLLTNKY